MLVDKMVNGLPPRKLVRFLMEVAEEDSLFDSEDNDVNLYFLLEKTFKTSEVSAI